MIFFKKKLIFKTTIGFVLKNNVYNKKNAFVKIIKRSVNKEMKFILKKYIYP
jgi:hypothetical protein